MRNWIYIYITNGSSTIEKCIWANHLPYTQLSNAIMVPVMVQSLPRINWGGSRYTMCLANVGNIPLWFLFIQTVSLIQTVHIPVACILFIIDGDEKIDDIYWIYIVHCMFYLLIVFLCCNLLVGEGKEYGAAVYPHKPNILCWFMNIRFEYCQCNFNFVATRNMFDIVSSICFSGANHFFSPDPHILLVDDCKTFLSWNACLRLKWDTY